MKILPGSIHQGDGAKFAYHGRQCCAISTVACGFALRKFPWFWTGKDVDDCVYAGDKLHILSKPIPKEKYLLVNELSPLVTLPNGENVNLVAFSEPVVEGPIHNDNADPEFGDELLVGLLKYLTQFSVGVLTCGCYCSGIMAIGGSYWIFDPHARSKCSGLIDTTGTAVFIKFSALLEIVTYLKQLYRVGDFYAIYRVDFSAVGNQSVILGKDRSVICFMESDRLVGCSNSLAGLPVSIGRPVSDRSEKEIKNYLEVLEPSELDKNNDLESDRLVGCSDSLAGLPDSIGRPVLDRSEKEINNLEPSELVENIELESDRLVGCSNSLAGLPDSIGCPVLEQSEKESKRGVIEKIKGLKRKIKGEQARKGRKKSHLNTNNESLVSGSDSLAVVPGSSVSILEKKSKQEEYCALVENNVHIKVTKAEKRKLKAAQAREGKKLKNINCSDNDCFNDVSKTDINKSSVKSVTRILNDCDTVEVTMEVSQYEKNREYSLEYFKNRLNNPVHKAKHLENMKNRLKNDPVYKAKNLENVRDRLHNNPEYKAKNLQNVRERLENNIEYKKRNLERIKKADAQNLLNAKYRKKNYYDKIKANSEMYEEKLKRYDTFRMSMSDINKQKRLIDNYFKDIKQGPTVICSCCGQMNFASSTSLLKEFSDSCTLKLESVCIYNSRKNDQYIVCSTCKPKLKNQTIPSNALINGIAFPPIPAELQGLTQLEERLLAVRQPFMKIFELSPYAGAQYGIKGSCINVPTDFNSTVNVLPRNLSESETVLVEFKRRMADKSPYAFELIRPERVYRAAEYLVNTDLYKKHKIVLDENWLQNANNEDLNIVTIHDNTDECAQDDQSSVSNLLHMDGTEDILENDPETNDTNVEHILDLLTSVTLEDENNEEAEIENELQIQESMIMSDIIPDHLSKSTGITIAPGEGKTPISLLRDEDADVLSFPSIYCGKAREFKVPLKDAELRKFEIRNYDRRAASNIPKVFMAFCKSRLKRLVNRISIALRKKRNTSEKTAMDVLTANGIESIIQEDEGYRVLDEDRSSPAYWEKKSKEALAVIRQHGPAHLFVTFTAAEVFWVELLAILVKINNNDDVTEEDIELLTKAEKIDLVKKDPVTCAWYFHHKFKCLMKVIQSDGLGPFRQFKVIRSVGRYEVQKRGSLHCHMLIWLKDSPSFDGDDSESIKQCEIFIDQFITCAKDDSLGDLIKRQYHRHTHTCKRGRQVCRFNYPIPPMRRTIILLPLQDMDAHIARDLKEIYMKIKLDMEEIAKNHEDCSFDVFLNKLGLDEETYTLAVRSSLKRPTVFLKRNLNERKINSYNRLLLNLWQANMDIQFILDPYATVKYVLNYVNKSQKGISKLLRDLAFNLKRGNLSLKDKLRQYVNEFTNKSEISAQEAVCHLLSIPMSFKTEAVVYVNTALPHERVHLMKSKADLEKLQEESTNITYDGLIEHYLERPSILNETCLADFAAMYEYSKKSKRNNISSNHVDDPDKICSDEDSNDAQTNDATLKNKWIALNNNSGYIKLRNKPKVIRFRNYNIFEDEINFFREQVMLYHNWRNENFIINNCKEIYAQHKASIEINRLKYNFKLSIDLEKAIQECRIEQYEEFDDSCVENSTPGDFAIFDIGAQDFDIGLEIPTLAAEHNCSSTSTFVIPTLLSNECFIRLLASLNDGQREYHDNFLHLVKTKRDKQFFHFICGAGGVGKSTLLNAITQSALRFYIHEINNEPNDLHILISAPTGKAAFNVKGQTIHSIFGFGFDTEQELKRKMSADKRNTLMFKLKKLKLLVIDEISMVSSELFELINIRLQEIFENNKPFGGISVLVMGDFNQLPPVRKSPIYEPLKDVFSTLSNADSRVITIKLPDGNEKYKSVSRLWSLFCIYKLTEIMRQKDDKSFAEALNRLAVGATTVEDDDMFRSRELYNLNLPDDAVLPDVVAIFHTNLSVDRYNDAVLMKCFDEGCNCLAIDVFTSPGKRPVKKEEVLYFQRKTYQKTQGLPRNFMAKIGAMYMITNNLDVNDGLANGASGVLRKIIMGENIRKEQVPLRLYLEFNHPDIGQKLRMQNTKTSLMDKADLSWTGIERIVKSMPLSNGSTKLVARKQFPCIPAQAITSYKSQSSSYEKVLVSIQGMSRRHVYTALSRVTSLEGLFIQGTYKSPVPPSLYDLSVNVVEQMLKECKLLFDLKFPYHCSDHYAVFHNIRSLNLYLPYVASNRFYRSADVLFFAETRFLKGEIHDIPGFICLHRTDCILPQRHAFGTALYVKQHISSMTISYCVLDTSYCGNKLEAFLNIVTLKTNEQAIIFVHKSPKYKVEAFKSKLDQAIQSEIHYGDVIVTGDFNLSPDQLHSYMKYYNLDYRLKGIYSTDYSTLIDLFYTSKVDEDAYLFESPISDHKPVWFKLSPNCQ